MRRFFLLIMLICFVGTRAYAQEHSMSVTDQLIAQAYEYSDSGKYNLALKTWNKCLDVLAETEGKDGINYFLAICAKSQVLIDLEKYGEAKALLKTVQVRSSYGLNDWVDYYKKIALCESKLGNINEAYSLYNALYNDILKCKESYVETNEGGEHWCWFDELCIVALEMSKLLHQNQEFGDAIIIISQTFQHAGEDQDKCYNTNESLYYLCFSQMVESGSESLSGLIKQDDFDNALLVYDSIIEIVMCCPDPTLIGKIDKQETVQYLLTRLVEIDKDKSVIYADQYLGLKHKLIDYWHETGMEPSYERCLLHKGFEYQVVGHWYEDFKCYDLAEKYYKKAKIFIEKNNLKRTEDYLNILSDISYILELQHISK